jgi:hypothetical protein
MYQSLFAPTWWMLLAGVVLAVVLFVHANMRLNGKLRMLSVGVLFLTAAWWGLGRMVETPIEASESGTNRFVAAVVARDGKTAGELLSVEAAAVNLNKTGIVAAVEKYPDDWGLTSATITGSEIEERGAQVMITIRVLSSHNSPRVATPTLPTDWQLTWVKEPTGYKLRALTPLRIGGTDLGRIVQDYFTTPPR